MFRTRWALATLLAVCLLGGCSDDDPEPNIDSDPTPSASTSSATVSPSESVTPSALGPEETLRAWVAARNEALRDGNTDAVRALSAGDCDTCDQHIEPIERVYAAGGSFDTPGWTVDRLKVVTTGEDKSKLDVAMTMSAGQTIEQAGATPTSYPEDHRLMFFRLGREADTWRVAFIGYYS